jgi:hypothetical protein
VTRASQPAARVRRTHTPAPVRLTAPERALLDAAERRLEEATRAHTLLCTAIVAARGHRLGAEVQIAERTPDGTLLLAPVSSPTPPSSASPESQS